MIRITASDISRRVNNRVASFNPSKVIKSNTRLYTESGTFCAENAFNSINNLERLSADSNIAFDMALDIFEECCLNLNESKINNLANFLLENIDKVRDANQLINSIKHKNSRLKTKIVTKINNRINNVTDMINYSLGNMSKTVPTGIASGVTNNIAKSEAFIDSIYDKLLTEAMKCKECDRIVENYNKLCKRYDIDKLISESSEVYDTAYTVASYVDTYPMKRDKNYGIALEAVYYGLSKHYIEFESADIINGVTDYFLFNNINESLRDDLKNATGSSLIFNDKDFNVISFIYDNYTDGTSIDEIEPEGYANNYGMVYKESSTIHETITQTIKDAFKGKRSKEDIETDKVDDMLSEFRDRVSKDANAKTNEQSFKAIINKLFATNVNTIIYGLPNLLTITVSAFLIGGSFAISVPLGILSIITTGIIKLTVDRDQCDKILKIYDKEFSKAKKKYENAKDETTKERWSKYKEALKDDVSKIRSHFDSLYTEEENDNRSDSDKNYSFDNDYDFDDDDFDFEDDFELESVINLSAGVLMSSMITNISEALVDIKDLDGIISNNIAKLSTDNIDALTSFSISNPTIIENRKLRETMVDYRDDLRKNRNIENFIKIDCLNENIYRLEKADTSLYKDKSSKEILCELAAISSIVSLNDKYYFNEMNFTNTLKLAANDLKRNAVKLSDKEKQVSNTIDMSVNSITKGIEKALMVENREAVIKGSIIPSASKCIKNALMFGAAWIVSPAIAVIGAIGAFAVSSKLRTKERQIILDDIELELKMCDRYIKQAEDKNDLKKVRELEKIQRNLHRQHQRIKYKMKVDFNQNVPDVKSSDDED